MLLGRRVRNVQIGLIIYRCRGEWTTRLLCTLNFCTPKINILVVVFSFKKISSISKKKTFNIYPQIRVISKPIFPLKFNDFQKKRVYVSLTPPKRERHVRRNSSFDFNRGQESTVEKKKSVYHDAQGFWLGQGGRD